MTQSTAEIVPISIEKEMRASYLDYAMSVIVSRALPDVRDGLKPVHRRILYAMHELGVGWNRPYKKSARIVGDVMGKYHPHGDSAIYDALVRMAQSFSMGTMLIQGQGNFGSMDGDSPAAMRYTEARMTKAAHFLLNDIERDTVNWKDNFSAETQEPEVLPAEFPNILVNGSGGIAVGMATNIPPYNLGEVIDGACAILDNPELSDDELAELIPAPDFPTGAIILGRSGALSALKTGRGSVVMRGKTEIETTDAGRETIIIHEVPYQVNKAAMVEKIAHLVRDKRIEGISDLRDESDKTGVRVVVEIKRDAMASIVLNHLFKHTPLQTSFGVNMLALDHGRPRRMNIHEMLTAFLAFREEVINRRTNFELGKARDRAHVLIGLALAVANIDEVIAVIRNSPDPGHAKKILMSRSWNAGDVGRLVALVDDHYNRVEDGQCRFTEAQARAILEMRLSRLTGLEQGKISEELEELAVKITDCLEILGSRERRKTIIYDGLQAIKEEFAVPRRTKIEGSEFEDDIEDLIQKEEMVVTVTMGGYIKRVPLSTYRAQRRGGKGRSGMTTKDEDITTEVFVANTHTPMLFFSTAGKAYKLKTYKLPLGNPQAKGRSLRNIFPLDEGETINVIMPLPEDESAWEALNIMFATQKGNIRRNSLSDFQSVRANGKIAMKLDDDDALIGVAVCAPEDDIMLAAKSGKALRCSVEAVRVFKGRNSSGVRGMNLADGDHVISMTVLNGSHENDTETRDAYLRIPSDIRVEIGACETLEDATALITPLDTTLTPDVIYEWAKDEEFILTLTENGFGKRSSAYEYRRTNRGAKGIVNIVTSERNGQVVASFPVLADDQAMLITDKGKLIRTPIHDVRIAGRNTQGVTVFKVADDEKVMSAAHIEGNDDDDDDEELEASEEGAVIDNDVNDATEEAAVEVSSDEPTDTIDADAT